MRIQDGALIAAATLSDRYIADRFLPDKAIDLVDEAASKIRIEIDSLPTEIDEVDRRIMQLQIELTSLGKEKDEASLQRREAIESELAELREQSETMKTQWRAEKEAIKGVRDLKEQLEQPRSRPNAPSAKRTCSAPRNCATATSPRSNGASRRANGRARERERGRRRRRRCSSKRRSTPTTSPKSSPAGPGSPSTGCSRARARSSCTWRSACTSG